MNTVISWTEILNTLEKKQNLNPSQSIWAMNQVMDGKASDEEIKKFLLGLKSKGESAEEITSFVQVMLDHAQKLEINREAVDTCGTGGDGLGTVNISTAAAIVVASCGIPVVKHGNRAASSKSGSADVLEALGISVNLTKDQVLSCFKQIGITFCFAPTFHPSMKNVAAARKSLATTTVFNFLGPLSNPSYPKAQVVGVSNLNMAPLIAQSLLNRDIKALVVRGLEGLDEISICGPTQIWDARSSTVKEFIFDATSIGVKKVSIDDLLGADAQTNAKLIVDSFNPDSSNSLQDAICVNAAAAIVAFDNQDLNFDDAMNLAFARAKGSIASGATLNLLNKWRNFSSSLN